MSTIEELKETVPDQEEKKEIDKLVAAKEPDKTPVTDIEHQEGKRDRDTVILNGRPIEPNCQWQDCKEEAVVQFHDTMTAKNQLLCQDHIKEKETFYKTGNQSYQVTPLMTQNKEKKKGKKKSSSK